MSSTDTPEDPHTPSPEPQTPEPYSAEPHTPSQYSSSQYSSEPYVSQPYQSEPEPSTATHEPTLILDDAPPDTTGTTTIPAAPVAESTPPATSTDDTGRYRPVRMRTVVLGLVLLVIAGSLLVGELTSVTVDAGAVFLALMIGGGLLLIAGARRS